MSLAVYWSLEEYSKERQAEQNVLLVWAKNGDTEEGMHVCMCAHTHVFVYMCGECQARLCAHVLYVCVSV